MLMYVNFKETLASILGPHHGSYKLLKVFTKGRYLGGAKEI